MEIVDGYAHCGLSKYEPVERVHEVMAAAGVGRAVLVQHLGEFDNTYLGRIAKDDPERFACVCLVDDQAADCDETLSHWAKSSGFKGVRLTLDVFSRRPQLADAAVELGLVIVLFAPRGLAGGVEPLTNFLDRHPHARLVVTHLGNPDVDRLPHLIGAHDMFRLARYPNVHFQVSGMKMFCPWPHEPLHPLIEHAFERFGAERLFWGSNFPVVGGASEYRDDLALLIDGKLPLPKAAVPALAGVNATRLWFTPNGPGSDTGSARRPS